MKLFKTKTKSFLYILAAIVVALIFIGIWGYFNGKKVSAAWFSEDWLYRKAVSIANTGALGTSYQVSFSIDTATLITAGKLQADCDDIRVTDMGGNLLPYWIETGESDAGTGGGCNATDTKVWTKIPSTFLTGSTAYVYYGNASASNAQNGNKVFEFFDDFGTVDQNKWTTSGSPTVSSGELTLSNSAKLVSKSLLSNTDGSRTLGIRAKTPVSVPSSSYLGFSNTNNLSSNTYADDSATVMLASEENYTTYIGSSNLVSYHKLEETTSTDANQFKGSGYLDTGKLSQGVSMYGNAAGTTGSTLTFNRGAQISGNNYEYFNSNQGTISFWFKPSWNGNPSTERDLFYPLNTSNSPRIYVSTNGGLYAQYYSAGTDKTATVSSPSWSSSSWYFVAVQWDIDAAVNGSQYLAVTVNATTSNNGPTTSFTTSTPASTFFIGSGDTGGRQAQALIDDFAIFDRVLSTTEISNIYNSGTGRTADYVADSSLKFYAKMDGSGTLSPVTYNGGATVDNTAYNSSTNTNGNMVTNSGFEIFTGTKDDDTSDAFTDWTTYGSPTRNEAVTDLYDNASLKVTATAVNQGVYMDFAANAGEDYYFSVWAKGDGVSEFAKVILVDPANTVIYAQPSTPLSTTWTKLESTFEIPAGKTGIRILLVSGATGASGTVSFDNVVLTPNSVNNGGMEGAGAGDADIWSGWVETVGNGALADTTTASELHSGGHAAKITTGSSGGNTYMGQNYTSVPGTTYLLSFWTRGDGTNAGRYSLWDSSNSQSIRGNTSTTVTGTTYTRFATTFVAPAGCTSLKVQLVDPSTSGGIAYFDDVSVIPLDNTALSFKAWAPVDDVTSAGNDLSVHGDSDGVSSSASQTGYGNAYTFDGSTGYLRQKTYDVNIGTLTYADTNTDISDTGQEFEDWDNDDAGSAEYMIVVTNSDNTTSWGYFCANDGGTQTAVYTLKACTGGSEGFTGTIGTPVGYEIRKTDFQITGSMTVGAWVNGNAFGSSNRGIFSKYDSSTTASYSMQYNRDTLTPPRNGKFEFQLVNTSNSQYFATGTTTPSTGTWYFVVGTVSGNDMTLYVNGTSEGTGTFSGTRRDTSDVLQIGQLQYGAAKWSGTIDSPFVLNTALTANQIKALYNTTKYNFATTNEGANGFADNTYSVTADTSYHKFEISQQSSAISYQTDALTATTATSNYADENSYVRLENADATNTVTLDYVYVRQSYATEPASSVSGTEEQSPGPVGYWKFDDAQGQTAQDSSSSNNDGTLGADSGSSTDDPAWTTEDQCISGKCLKFDGGDYVTVSDSNSLDTLSAVTVEAWIKPNLISSDQNIISKYDRDTGGNGQKSYLLRITGTNGTFMFSVSNNGSTDNAVSTTVAATANNWTHVVGRYDGSTLKIFINGVEKATTNYSSGIYAGTEKLYIGARRTTDPYFTGFIDEPKVYPYARTLAQIRTDYLSGSSKAGSSVIASTAKQSQDGPGWMSNGLVGYWKMDETSGTSVADASGNSNTGTLTSAQETGTGETEGSTTTLVDADNADLSTTDDVYNNMILRITGGGGCGITTGTERTISDYTGSTKTITLGTAFAAETDSCTFEIRHQTGGKYGNGVQFDGVNDLINAGSQSVLNLTNVVTLSAWIKPSATQTYSSSEIISKSAGAAYYRMRYESTNTVTFLTFGTSGASLASTTTIPTGVWTHIVMTYDGTQKTIYINGNKDKQAAATGAMTGGSAALYIGGYGFGSNEIFNGNLDETRIYNRALSPKEVSDLYNFAPGPVGYWDFEGGSEATVVDKSGGGYNGTFAGTGPYRVGGKYGKAGNFVNTNNKLPTTLSINTFRQGTISMWVKELDVSGGNYNYLVTSANTCNKGMPIAKDTANMRYLGYSTGQNVYWASPNNSLILNIWQYLTVTWDSGGTYFYINGILKTSDTAVDFSDLSDWNTNVLIGSQNINCGTANNTNKQLIDDVKIYNYARTQKQIVEDMNAGHPAVGTPVGSAVAHYKFDEGYGQTANNSGSAGSSLNGTLGVDTGSSTDDPTWSQSGKFGKALSFDGGDFVTKADDNALSITGSLSLSAWIKRDNTSREEGVLAKYDTTGNQRSYQIYIFNTNKALFVLSTNGSAGIVAGTSTTSLLASQWYHIVGTFDSTTEEGKIYINGKLENTVDTNLTSLFDSTALLRIGAGPGTGVTNNFDGIIDEPKIYNYALTSDEVKTEYNRGSSLVLGSLGSNSSYSSNASNQEYCIPGDSTSCAAPVAEWNFEENTGTSANDKSGNGNTGTLGGDGAGTDLPSWTTGKVGAGLKFDGSDDYVDVGDPASGALDFGSGDFTLQAWIYPTLLNDALGYHDIISKRTASENGSFNFRTTSTNGLVIANRYNDTWGGVSGSGWQNTISTNNWYHISLVRQGNNYTLYVNGVSKGTQANSISGVVYGNDASLVIGGNDSFFKGSIDQVRVFNYARTPAQIAWDYNRGKPVGHWKMDECQGPTVHDSSGNNNSGTITVATGNALGTCTTASTFWGGTGGTGAGKRNFAPTFDGTDDKITIGTAITGVQSVAFWVKPATNSDSFMDLDGGTHYITASSGTVSATGFSTPTIYVNGISGGTLTGGAWNHIVVTTATAFNSTTSFTLGYKSAATADYLNGQIDDVKIFNYALTPLQVKTEYNGGAVNYSPVTGSP